MKILSNKKYKKLLLYKDEYLRIGVDVFMLEKYIKKQRNIITKLYKDIDKLQGVIEK